MTYYNSATFALKENYCAATNPIPSPKGMYKGRSTDRPDLRNKTRMMQRLNPGRSLEAKRSERSEFINYPTKMLQQRKI